MVIETRFSLGQEVWQVGRQKHIHETTCPSCEGRGRVNVRGADGVERETYCPYEKCRGRGHFTERTWDIYRVRGSGLIGSIEVRIFDTKLAPSYADRPREERYMIDSTGIGSGTVHALEDGEWAHTHLFATEDEAQAFCDAENPALRTATTQEMV